MESKTHKYITRKALEYLDLDIDNKEKEGIIFYSVQPDIDEKEGSFKNHFYNPATRKNFRGERQSAMTKYIYYYNLAKERKRAGMPYYEPIGRCLHFLEDINTPVHTYYEDLFDATIRLGQHIKFENYCNTIVEKLEETCYNYVNLEYYLNNNIKSIAKMCARESSILFYKYDHINKKEEIDAIAKEAIKNGIDGATGILYKLFNEYK